MLRHLITAPHRSFRAATLTTTLTTTLAVTVTAGLALAGCGGDEAAQELQPATSRKAEPSQAATFVPPLKQATPTPTPMRAERSLSGTVEAGVEAGCLVLRAEGATWLLLGDKATPSLQGEQVLVLGRAAPDTVTTCQQGTPFLVSAVALP